jgi:hypothetical protein
MTTLIRIFFFSIFLSYFPIRLSAANCASGNITINSVIATSGNGSYTNPALGSIQYEFCYKLSEYFESSTNWVHGIFVSFEDIPTGFTIKPGATGAQGTQAGNRNWVFFDSLKAFNHGLPGPGYYVDDSDGNPTNNYGDNGLGTPIASFPNLSPFCFIAEGNCGIPRIIKPCITVTGDGTTGAWRNGDCTGDLFCTSSTGPNNDGTIAICGSTLVLDIVLYDFKAYPENRDNIIEWKAKVDDSFAQYELEKTNSRNSKFELLAKIPQKNAENSSIVFSSYIDKKPYFETYYRLKLLDKEGKYQYSKIQKVVNRTYRKLDAELYFSQDKNELIFSYDDVQNQNFSIKIFDLRSILLFDEKITTTRGFNTKLYSLDWLKPGIYFANLGNSTGQNTVVKFIKY